MWEKGNSLPYLGYFPNADIFRSYFKLYFYTLQRFSRNSKQRNKNVLQYKVNIWKNRTESEISMFYTNIWPSVGLPKAVGHYNLSISNQVWQWYYYMQTLDQMALEVIPSTRRSSRWTDGLTRLDWILRLISYAETWDLIPEWVILAYLRLQVSRKHQPLRKINQRTNWLGQIDS